jgi:DNA-binding beta-propeller fold protein YncE
LLRWIFFAAVALAARAADTPSPALLVLNKDDATLAIVDPRTRAIAARVPTGSQPHEVAASSDGRTAFVANYATNTLTVVDLVRQTGRTADLGALRRPHGIVFAAGKVFFSAEANQAFGRLDPSTGRVDLTVNTGQDVSHMIWASADARRVFTSNMGSNSITAFEQSGDSYTSQHIRVGAGPEGFDVSPGGKELWTAHSRDGGVSIIDIASRKVTQTIPRLTQQSNRLKFTPDGRQVLISDAGTGDLVVLDAASRKETRRLRLCRAAFGILIPPSGGTAYVACGADDEVAIVDLRTFAVSGRIKTGTNPDGMAWAERK